MVKITIEDDAKCKHNSFECTVELETIYGHGSDSLEAKTSCLEAIDEAIEKLKKFRDEVSEFKEYVDMMSHKGWNGHFKTEYENLKKEREKYLENQRYL